MSSDLLSCEPEMRFAEAARRMDERGVGAILVLEGTRLAGILTERDILRAVARGYGTDDAVADWMTHHLETIEASECWRTPRRAAPEPGSLGRVPTAPR
jgi:CBS domain-containing protein